GLENFTVVPNCAAGIRRTQAENSQLHEVPGTLAERPRCMESREELGKVLPSPCNRGTKPGLFTGAGHRRRRRCSKNTRPCRAINIRMSEVRRKALGKRESTAKLLQKHRGKLLTRRTDSRLLKSIGRYPRKVVPQTRRCRRIVALLLKFQLPPDAFLTKHSHFSGFFAR